MHDSAGTRRASFPPERPRTQRQRLLFGGVVFELLVDADVRWQLPASYHEHLAAPPDALTIADVICSLSVDRALPAFDGWPRNRLRLEHESSESGHMLLSSAQMRAELSRVAPARYAARVRVNCDEDPASSVLFGVASGILQCEGGLNLHAAAVELDGHAVLFLGPSGAGKSTAAGLTQGAPLFAADRVGLIVRGDRLFALGLPGGDANGSPRSSQRSLPVAGICRVRRGERQASIQPLQGAARVFALRASVESSDGSLAAEDARFSAIARICERASVYDLHTVLGEPIDQLLRTTLLMPPTSSRTEDSSEHVVV